MKKGVRMSKDKDSNSKEIKLEEGMIKKGGVNPKPSSERPSEPPKGQSSEQDE